MKLRPLIITGVTIFAGFLMIMAIQNLLIFYPDRYPVGNWQPQQITPEDAWFQAEDGAKLHGWYVRAENPRAFAVYSHGNGGNITMLADYLKVLSERLGISVLAYDYRGYGRSSGTPDLKRLPSDGYAATTWLAKREGIAPEQIIQIGRSLGGGVALQTAIRAKSVGLILENTFTSIADMGKQIYPWLPIKLLLRGDLPSLDSITQYHGALLIVHGDRDELVPEAMGRKLYDAANEPKQYLSIIGGGHNDFPPPYYFLEIDRFISRF